MITQRHNPAYRFACFFDADILFWRYALHLIYTNKAIRLISDINGIAFILSFIYGDRRIFLHSICNGKLHFQDRSAQIHDPVPVRWMLYILGFYSGLRL